MRSAVIYCRISNDTVGNGLGVERQEAECRALAKREQLQVVEVLADNDISAYSGKRRPAYERTLRLLESGEASVLIAWHPDRITRNTKELNELIDRLNACGADVRTVQAGHYDLSTPAGRMQARVVGSFSQYESELKSARLQSKHLQLAQNGQLSGGGSRPYGYSCNNGKSIQAGERECAVPGCTHDGLSLIEHEAAVIRRTMAEYLAGRSLTGIARDLNRDGNRRVNGGEWTAMAVRKLLESPRLAGVRSHHGAGVVPAVWPAIVSLEDHQLALARLAQPFRRTAPRRYVLAGLLVCSSCNTKLVARPKSGSIRCYVCPHPNDPGIVGEPCGKRRQIADTVEQYVIEGVFARLDGVDLAALTKPADESPSGALAELERIDARLAELGEMWATGELDRTGWQAARQALEAQRAQANAAVASTVDRRRSALPAGQLRTVWPSLDIDRQRAILGELIERIDLGPAIRGQNFFNPSRVHVTWKV